MGSERFGVVEGAVLGLAAGFSPGPLLALVITQSLRFGAREGVKVAFVPLLTDMPAIMLSLVAVDAVSGFGRGLGAITLLGAVFVVYLAYDCLRAIAPGAQAQAIAPKSVKRGVLINVLSPYPYLFWLTVGAPIVVRAWHSHWVAAVGFVASFYVGLVGAKVVVAIMTGRSRTLLAGRGYVFLMRALAVLLAVFGIRLFWEGLQLVFSPA